MPVHARSWGDVLLGTHATVWPFLSAMPVPAGCAFEGHTPALGIAGGIADIEIALLTGGYGMSRVPFR
jgi:hypothetical protein